MSDPYIGEIRAFGFNFAPVGWAFCNGQLLSISTWQALFAVIGTTYGGNGQTTFATPNLQGLSPMHWGTLAGLNTTLGQVMGTTSVTLTTAQIPQHTHTVTVAQAGGAGESAAIPTANQSFLGASAGHNLGYQKTPTSFTAAFSPKAILPTGGSQPHENMQPYLCFNFCIATEGIFPSQN